MSVTSTKIFGNYMAMDVKEDFRLLWGIGKSVDEIQDYRYTRVAYTARFTFAFTEECRLQPQLCRSADTA